MPMWRDPWDELIADLERSVPTSAVPDFDMPPPMEDYCYIWDWLFARDPATRARMAEDPHIKRILAYHERCAARLATEPEAADSGKSPG